MSAITVQEGLTAKDAMAEAASIIEGLRIVLDRRINTGNISTLAAELRVMQNGGPASTTWLTRAANLIDKLASGLVSFADTAYLAAVADKLRDEAELLRDLSEVAQEIDFSAEIARLDGKY